jgi:hypothetical protein
LRKEPTQISKSPEAEGKQILCQRDVDDFQLFPSLVEGNQGETRVVSKALLFRLGNTKLRIYQEQNHQETASRFIWHRYIREARRKCSQKIREIDLELSFPPSRIVLAEVEK